MRKLLITLILLSFNTIDAQTDKDLALSKAEEAIKLMDEGNVEESIELLEESHKLDPDNYVYPYEIAYAKILQKEYKEAIDILEKLKSHESINSQVYQILGNSYSYLGKPKKAIKKYEEGLEKFPNSGNLYLEIGNIFNQQEEYSKAINNYKTGIQVDPMFPSNYYNQATLYLRSNDKLSGLIYGEVFMNIERTTDRTRKMSELLYDTYKNSITLSEEESRIDFCDIIIDGSTNLDGDIKLPLCAIFGKNFVLSIIDQKEINLSTLSEIRTSFLKNYFQEDFKEYPNILFSYQKEMLDKDLFNAYNHYLFQIGAPEEFNRWYETNESDYSKFVEWYTKDENILAVSQESVLVK